LGLFQAPIEGAARRRSCSSKPSLEGLVNEGKAPLPVQGLPADHWKMTEENQNLDKAMDSQLRLSIATFFNDRIDSSSDSVFLPFILYLSIPETNNYHSEGSRQRLSDIY
jgi:hypothetical protein